MSIAQAHHMWNGPGVGSAVLCGSAADWPCAVKAWTDPVEGIIVLRVSGEVDLLTCPVLAAELGRAIQCAPRHLVVDLSAVRFCAVRGFGLIADARRATTSAGMGFAVSGLGARLDRVAAILWAGDGPIRYRDVAAALAAIRDERSG